MRHPRPTAAAVLILAAATVVVAGSTRVAPEFETPDLSPEGQQKMMAEYMRLMSPGERHEMLGYFVGDWKATQRIWMGGAGQADPPMVSEGTATYEWILGGRFLRQTYEGSMMGMPYEGEGLLGYDNYSGKYQNTWVSTMSTTISYMDGFAHQDGKGMTLWGEMDEPTLEMRGKTVKHVTRVRDEDTFVFEIHDPHIEGETKVVEVVYEREE